MSVRSFDMTVTTFGPRALATAPVMRKSRNSEIVVRFMEPLSFGWRMRDQVPARERPLIVNVDLIEVDVIGLQVAQALFASRLDVDAARAAIVVAPACRPPGQSQAVFSQGKESSPSKQTIIRFSPDGIMLGPRSRPHDGRLRAEITSG